MSLVDTHCHLQDAKFDGEREAVIARALECLSWLVVVGDDLPNSETAIALTRDRVYAAVGFHPYHADLVDAASLKKLRVLAENPKVVAIGEIGLDYYNEFSPRAVQRKAFPLQLQLAAEMQLPVAIHNRQADADTLSILEEYVGALPGCILHCFGSDAAAAERFLEMGCYISFAGNVTYKSAQPLRDAAQLTPLERLLVETDAPYLSPQPRRGKRCEPAFVQHTAAALAEVKQVPLEVLTQHTTDNAHRIYGVSHDAVDEATE